jgi:hypothetical protein
MTTDDQQKPQRSIFEDRFTGNVLKKKRRSLRAEKTVSTVGDNERKIPSCKSCGGEHYTRSCKVGK